MRPARIFTWHTTIDGTAVSDEDITRRLAALGGRRQDARWAFGSRLWFRLLGIHSDAGLSRMPLTLTISRDSEESLELSFASDAGWYLLETERVGGLYLQRAQQIATAVDGR